MAYDIIILRLYTFILCLYNQREDNSAGMGFPIRL